METKKGACRFCGQNKMIEVPNGYTQEEIDEEVTCECKCDEAKAYQEKKERKGWKHRSSPQKGQRSSCSIMIFQKWRRFSTMQFLSWSPKR